MTKEDIINTINKYKLNKDEFIVISGAALVLLDIKDSAKDIDIWVSDSYQEYLLNNYTCEFERINEFGNKAYLIDDIINFGTSFKPNEYVLVDGIKVSLIKDILELKKFLNRDKDKEIIEKLESIYESSIN